MPGTGPAPETDPMEHAPTEPTPCAWGAGKAALASLVPWAAFMAAAAATAPFAEYRSVDLAGMLRSAPFYVWVISVFSFFPIVAGRTRRTQAAATLLMTAVAVWAGVVAVAQDDAQAGMAVLVVPPAALALAVVIVAARAVVGLRGRGDP